ncbi:MAG TPA: signal peptide peptidase SppA [Candidatus Binatia bacterium]|nr:signal peptide peptidase SppA [Candidatus Binatia bacterium]
MAVHPLRRALGFLVGFLVLFFLAALAVSLTHDHSGRLSLGSDHSVALVPLEGEIRSSDDFVETLDDLADRGSIAAVVVRINSPGGAVAPSQEMYAAVRRLREKKPVVASLGSVAASGGYYVASAADVVVANPGTLTGSIGVILSLANVTGLLEKIGVQAEVLKAGSYKDMGSPFRPMTDEDRAAFQEMLDQVHTQFIDAVATGRKMDPADARRIANGRVYTGQQAKDLGLVDELGGVEEAVRIAASRSGITGEPTVERISPTRRPWWLRMLMSDRVAIPAETSLPLGIFEWLAKAADRSVTGDQAPVLWRMPIATDGIRW